jgi:IS30 family transposase
MKNKQKFSHLSKSERNEIAILLNKKYEQKDIVKVLNRTPSTISDEISRNKVNGKYDPKKAHQKARTRRMSAKYQGKKIVDNPKLREFVEKHLLDDQSPAALAGRLKKNK